MSLVRTSKSKSPQYRPQVTPQAPRHRLRQPSGRFFKRCLTEEAEEEEAPSDPQPQSHQVPVATPGSGSVSGSGGGRKDYQDENSGYCDCGGGHDNGCYDDDEGGDGRGGHCGSYDGLALTRYCQYFILQ